MSFASSFALPKYGLSKALNLVPNLINYKPFRIIFCNRQNLIPAQWVLNNGPFFQAFLRDRASGSQIRLDIREKRYQRGTYMAQACDSSQSSHNVSIDELHPHRKN